MEDVESRGFLERQKDKHERYLSILFHISFTLAYISAFINWILNLFTEARDGNVIGFVLLWLFQGIFMMLNGLVGGVLLFLFLLLVTFIPYLILRGLTRN